MSWAHRRLVEPVLGQLRQGVTPDKLAWSLALGIGLGIFPVLGTTTVLCATVALGLRLNQPAIQLVNYLVYPLQLLLLIPFLQAGQWLFGRPPLPLTLAQLQAELAALGVLAVLSRYAVATLRAVMAWALVAPPLIFTLRLVLRPLIARLPIGRAAAGRLAEGGRKPDAPP
jgi:uncharacterized protein (DUF2062 family)